MGTLPVFTILFGINVYYSVHQKIFGGYLMRLAYEVRYTET